MNRVLLQHYFDEDHWTVDLLTAFFAVKPKWLWSNLQNQFLIVCCQLKTPAGSASPLVRIIKAWPTLGYLTFTPLPETDGKNGWFERTETFQRKPLRSLVRAIHWSNEREAAQEDRRLARALVLRRCNEGAIKWPSANRRLKIIDRNTDARLQRIDITFRLKP
jgi:hypothetical protein